MRQELEKLLLVTRSVDLLRHNKKKYLLVDGDHSKKKQNKQFSLFEKKYDKTQIIIQGIDYCKKNYNKSVITY